MDPIKALATGNVSPESDQLIDQNTLPAPTPQQQVQPTPQFDVPVPTPEVISESNAGYGMAGVAGLPALPTIAAPPLNSRELQTSGPTPGQVLDAVQQPQIDQGIRQQGLESQMFNQGAVDAVEFPTIYTPPNLESLANRFNKNSSALIDGTLREQQQQRQQQQQSQVDYKGYLNQLATMNTNPQAPTRGGFEWVTRLLGSSEDGGRQYVGPAFMNKQTGQWEGSPLGGVLYTLGVVQNTVVGGALDTMNLTRRGAEIVGDAYNQYSPPWLRTNLSGVVNSNPIARDIANTVVGAITGPRNKYDDGKSNLVEALRGAQYSFSDDAGKGFGIKQNVGVRVGAAPGKGFGFDFNPTVVLGLGLDVVTGARIDKVAGKLLPMGAKEVAQVAKVTADQTATVGEKLAVAAGKSEEFLQLEAPFIYNPSIGTVKGPKVPRVTKRGPKPYTPTDKQYVVMAEGKQGVFPLPQMRDEFRKVEEFSKPNAYKSYEGEGQLVLPLSVKSNRLAAKPKPISEPKAKPQTSADVQGVLNIPQMAEELITSLKKSEPLAWRTYPKNTQGQLGLPLGVTRTKAPKVERLPISRVKETPAGVQLVLPVEGMAKDAERILKETQPNLIRSRGRGQLTLPLFDTLPEAAPIRRSVTDNIAPGMTLGDLRKLYPDLSTNEFYDVMRSAQVSRKVSIYKPKGTKQLGLFDEAVVVKNPIPTSPVGVAAANVETNLAQALVQADSLPDIARRFSPNIPERPTSYTPTNVYKVPSVKLPDTYHGTKVKNFVPDATIDYARGATVSELGLGLHLSRDSKIADAASRAMINPDLPPVATREFSQVGEVLQIKGMNRKLLNAQEPKLENRFVANKILVNSFPELEPIPPGKISLTDIYDDIAKQDPELLREFQRHMQEALQAEGIQGVYGNKGIMLFKSDGLEVTARQSTPPAGSAVEALHARATVDVNASDSLIAAANSAESRAKWLTQVRQEMGDTVQEIEQNLVKAVDEGLAPPALPETLSPVDMIRKTAEDYGDPEVMRLVDEGDYDGALQYLKDEGVDTFDIEWPNASRDQELRPPNPCGF